MSTRYIYRTEIKTRYTRSALTPELTGNGNGRTITHITATPERRTDTFSVGEWPLRIAAINFWPLHFRNGYVPAVSIMKPPCAVRRLKKRNGHLDAEVVKKIRWGF